jgi:hypothetical protein
MFGYGEHCFRWISLHDLEIVDVCGAYIARQMGVGSNVGGPFIFPLLIETAFFIRASVSMCGWGIS